MLALVFLLGVLLTTGHPGLPFYGPDNLVFDRAGNAYVVDTDHHTKYRIVVLDRHGNYLSEWHVFAPPRSGPHGPEGIAIDASGNVYATDAGAGTVYKLSHDGTILAHFGKRGTGAGEFINPGHVAVDRHGDVYVVDSVNNTITKFAPNGRLVLSWKRPHGTGIDALSMPQSIAVDTSDNIFIEDWGNHRVVKLTPDGIPILAFTGEGGPGHIDNSAGLVLYKDRPYIADQGAQRIAIYQNSGRYVAAIANDPRHPKRFLLGPSSVAVGRSNYVYFADGRTIRVLDGDRHVVAVWGAAALKKN